MVSGRSSPGFVQDKGHAARMGKNGFFACAEVHMSDPGKQGGPGAARRAPEPTLLGWLGLLGLMALVFAGVVVTGRLLGRALYLVLQ